MVTLLKKWLNDCLHRKVLARPEEIIECLSLKLKLDKTNAIVLNSQLRTTPTQRHTVWVEIKLNSNQKAVTLLSRSKVHVPIYDVASFCRSHWFVYVC